MNKERADQDLSAKERKRATDFLKKSNYDTLGPRPSEPVKPSVEIEVGQKIGKYEVLEKLGQGAFGAVFRCLDRFADRHVGVKVFKGPIATRGDGAAEARANTKIKHPQIARLLDHGRLEESGIEYLVFEFVRGDTLASLIKQQGSFSQSQALDIVRSICEPLQEIHAEGVTHRDLKPANIMIDENQQAVLLDFGVAIHENQQLEMEDHVAGTQPFMSPEQLQGQLLHLDGRSDIWALGVILYEMATGALPFQSREAILSGHFRPPSMRKPTLSRKVDEICDRCLRVKLSERFGSVAQLIPLLDEARNESKEETDARMPGQDITKSQRVRKAQKRLAWPTWFLNTGAGKQLLLLATLVALTGVSWWHFSKQTAGVNSGNDNPNSTEPDSSYSQEIATKTAEDLARYVIELGGEISLDLGGGQSWESFTDSRRLPKTTYSVVGIDLRNLEKVNDQTLKQLTSFPIGEVTAVDLQHTAVTEDGLGYLFEFPYLVDLDLSGLEITDDGAKQICQLSHCQYLYISDTLITDEGIATIAEMRLKYLDIENLNGVTDKSAKVLSKIRTLEDLKIEGTSISLQAVKQWGLGPTR